MNIKLVKILSLVFTLMAAPAWANECLQNRGSIDFGSGTTKLLALSVNVCEKKIVKVIFEERLALAFNEAFESSKDKNIPTTFYRASLPQIQAAVEKLRTKEVKDISAVATAVFRNAKNGKAVIAEYSKVLNLPIKVISQKEEAELGFWSVLSSKAWTPTEKSVVVWDIGGGSMQMYAWNGGKAQIFEGKLASVSFKNEVIKKLQQKNPKEVSSPNPLGEKREAAVELAKKQALLKVPRFFKKLPASTEWIGIGGVLSISVQQQVNKDAAFFDMSSLESALKIRALLRDDQIPSEYRVSDVSNLALVLGYMRALDIKKVETLPASLGQGLVYKQLHTKN